MNLNIPFDPRPGQGQKAFSLLEMTIVITIMSVILTIAVPSLYRAYVEKAGRKTALDISAIQEAARDFYINNNQWPNDSADATAMAALQAGNYLPSNWNPVNPFGSPYTTASKGALFTVSTDVPVAAEPIIRNLLPTNWVKGNTLSSSVPVPSVSSVMPTGSIMPWASSNLPDGFLWCNGQTVNISDYPALFAVLGTVYGGDGLNTFGLPNLMGRTIVGIDGMGKASPAHLISQWSNAPSAMGGTFGEDKHALTIAEMPPHDHQTLADNAPNAGAYLDFKGNGDWKGWAGGGTGLGLLKYRTSFRGGNQDGNSASKVVAHNVVQPSMALGYVIKF